MTHRIFRLVSSLFLALALTAVAAGAQPVRAAGPWYVSINGDDTNDCLSPGTACATINGAVGKVSSGDTILVSVGTYTGAGNEVLLLDKDATLSGGWDASFTTQNGMSTIDGEAARRGIKINTGVTATIDHFMIQNGSFVGFGGGIYNAGTSLTLNNSSLINSKATGDGGGNSYGGGINTSGTTTINDSTISGNEANEGGGIFNSHFDASGLGNPGVLTLNRVVLTDNTAGGAGGGILNGGFGNANMIINSSLLTNNTARDGAGIYNIGNSAMAINNSTISGNSAGGGIANQSFLTTTLNNTTISNNGDGGILNINGDLNLKNSIVAGNMGSDCFGPIVSAGYNIIGNTSNCDFANTTGDLINIDPLLGPLQDNGGPTLTHALLALSLAIDAGDPAGCTDQDGNLLTTDQRGFNRPEGTQCDIGAYEYADITSGPATSLAVLSGSGQQSSQNTAFSEPLRAVALDGLGNRVSGVTVTFTAPTSGPSGTFADTGTNTTTVDTDAGGVATTSVFTANGELGDYVVSASATGLGSVSFSLEQIIPSPDNFGDALEFTSLPFSTTADITDSTIEPGEPQFCSISERTVWYSFTPTQNMTVQADTLGGAVAGIVNVYSSGFGVSELGFLGCALTHGSVNFNAEAGQTYYLQVGSVYFGEVGSVQINLAQIFPPANDNFATAESIASLPYSATVNITNATYQPGEPQSCYSMERTVWYLFTPTENLVVRATTEGSAISGNVNTYLATGPGISYLQFLNCSGGANNAQPFIAEAGQTYYLQVGFASWEVGSIQINLEKVLPPANDDFASAISIDSFPSTTDFTNSGARMESGEPSLSCDYGSPSAQSTVWFSFTATQDETISANIFNSTFPPIWVVYSGTGLDDLTELGCRSYDNLSWRANAGQTYYIQVSGLFGSSGTGTLSLEAAAPPQAYFYFDPFDPSKSETIQFYDYSYDPAGIGIETWEWDFGDGTPPSAAQYPTHIYSADGNYSVTLTVTTFDGRSASTTQTVQVRTQFTFTIDIKPGSQTNPINPRSSGKIPVAILSTPDFNAPLEVDRASLTFGSTGNEHSLVSCNRKGTDVNGDGFTDLMCHFKTKLGGFKFGDTEGILKGQTLIGVAIEAHDVVRVLHASYP